MQCQEPFVSQFAATKHPSTPAATGTSPYEDPNDTETRDQAAGILTGPQGFGT
jgi:hypothetical protein